MRVRWGNNLSDGEQRLGLAYLAIAVFGGILALSVQNRLSDHSGALPVFDWHTLWVCSAGALGAGFAFRLCRGGLGWAGFNGVANALIQGFWVTAIGAVIAGSLVLPIYGTMFAPWLLLMTFITSPLLLVMWIIVLTASHILLARWQAERNSIFVPLKSRAP